VDTQNTDQNIAGADAGERFCPASSPWTAKLLGIAAERDQLLAEKVDLQDRLLRQRAEFDNFRRRAELQRSEYLQ